MRDAPKSRAVYAALTLVTIGAGLLSRSSLFESVAFVRLYVGDSLWALVAYWLVGVIRPDWTGRRRFLAALGFAFAVELSQLYQAEWINDLRATTVGALILGFGFKLTDLVAYTLGVAVGALLDARLVARH